MNNNNAIIERSILSKIYSSQTLQKKYLVDLYYNIFTEERRYIAFLMIRLFRDHIPITIENLRGSQLESYRKKFGMNLTHEIIEHELTVETQISDTLFEDVYQSLHDEAFLRISDKLIDDMRYHHSYGERKKIIIHAQALLKLDKLFTRHKAVLRHSPIARTAKYMTKGQPFQALFSNILNSVIRGWARGFANSMIGKPSHGKTTFMTWDTVFNVMHGLIDRADVISAEEPDQVFWRRVIGMFLKIPASSLIDGDVTVSKEQVKAMEKVFLKRLYFHQEEKFSHAADLMNSIDDSDFMWFDHLNAFVYPYGDMYKGIIRVIEEQKRYLKVHPQTAIVNLSQPNTKQMLKAGRLFPKKEDAYNSSILEQASREFLSIYYPYVDATNPELQKYFRRRQVFEDVVQISVEKNSFGKVGVFDMEFLSDIGIYKDMPKEKNKLDVILPKHVEVNNNSKITSMADRADQFNFNLGDI